MKNLKDLEKRVDILSRFQGITTSLSNKYWAAREIKKALITLNTELNDKVRRKSKISQLLRGKFRS